MKVVLFCGGQGLRLRDYSDQMPKPMVPVGNRPILWHLMKYYAHYGHRDFILCLGYQAEVIKQYFLSYSEALTNDFTLYGGGKGVELHSVDLQDWTISFVYTGVNVSIGQRLLRVKEYLGDEECFLANYADNLTDAPLPHIIDRLQRQPEMVAGCLSVRLPQSFHVLSSSEQGLVTSWQPIAAADIWANGGFFVLRRSIFEYLHAGEELVVEAFQRLIQQGRLTTFRWSGFWACMDTFKEKMMLEDLDQQGRAPWKVWLSDQDGAARSEKAVRS